MGHFLPLLGEDRIVQLTDRKRDGVETCGKVGGLETRTGDTVVGTMVYMLYAPGPLDHQAPQLGIIINTIFPTG